MRRALAGTGQAMADLMAGQIDLMFDAAITAVPPVKAGKLQALAVSGGRRLADLLHAGALRFRHRRRRQHADHFLCLEQRDRILLFEQLEREVSAFRNLARPACNRVGHFLHLNLSNFEFVFVYLEVFSNQEARVRPLP